MGERDDAAAVAISSAPADTGAAYWAIEREKWRGRARAAGGKKHETVAELSYDDLESLQDALYTEIGPDPELTRSMGLSSVVECAVDIWPEQPIGVKPKATAPMGPQWQPQT